MYRDHNERQQYSMDWQWADELIVDLFAGGGGMSTAMHLATGISPHIACNHDADAISMHEANHPQTRHYQADVYELDPHVVCAGRAVGLLHASPDCTHHSQAAGGQPRDRKIRSLSWVVKRWAAQVRPRVITLENVRQITKWGPLVARRCKSTGRVLKRNGTVANPGEVVPVSEQYLVPDPKRLGRTWQHFIRALQDLGYRVEWRLLCAADYGAPTTRERLFMVARCDGQPIVWPAPTHHKKPARGQKRWRAAAECIDWSIPGKSIFDRDKPLAEATMRRIAKGIKKFVLDNPEPFIVKFRGDSMGASIRQPLFTVTSGGNAKRPAGCAHALGLATPVLAPVAPGNGSRQSPVLNNAQPFIVPIAHYNGSEPVYHSTEPLRTITASPKGGSFAVAQPVLTPVFSTLNFQDQLQDQHVTVTASAADGHAVAAAYLMQANDGFDVVFGKSVNEPVSTVTSSGSHQQLVVTSLMRQGSENAPVDTVISDDAEARALRVAAFLINYYGNGDARNLGAPMDTLTTRDRLALVTVHLDGEPYYIVDITLRMLEPHELYKAQGFPADYIITHGHDGRRFSKTAQVRMCGNSVSPPPAIALIKANYQYQPSFAEAI